MAAITLSKGLLMSKSELSSSAYARALNDWAQGTKRIDVWLTLAWFDVVLRYRRSTLGPLWLTISMGAMIAGMGPLYSALFGVDLNKFFPHLALGIIFWTLFSTITQESATVFINSANFIKQANFPITIFIWRMLAKCFIQFAHHIILYIPVAIFVGIHLSAEVLWFFPALALLVINSHFVAIILGILCTRFRDFAQIVNSVMQLLMFLTPVFWLPSSLPDRAKYMLWNPFAQMLDLLRTPLLGGVANENSWLSIIAWTVVNALFAFFLFLRYRRRIVFWL